MTMPSVLAGIAAERRQDVALAKGQLSLAELKCLAEQQPPGPGRLKKALAEEGLSLIAEIKRASPSRGKMAEISDPKNLAASYLRGGARAISVLTEPRHFQGKPEDLKAVSSLTLPVLRKDFLVDEYQVWEARAWGASACLLIAAMLETRDFLENLLAACQEAQVDALVEVHNQSELDLALQAGAQIIGINHRNLHTFSMNMDLFEELNRMIPEGVLTVAESGIHTSEDARRMADLGADGILVGEHLATSNDACQAVQDLMGPSC